jgi:hypothetical protein
VAIAVTRSVLEEAIPICRPAVAAENSDRSSDWVLLVPLLIPYADQQCSNVVF